MRSEWTKFRSLRSTVYTLLLTVVLAIGVGALIANGQGRSYGTTSAREQTFFDPTASSLTGCFLFAQLTISILGVLGVTSEYATGMIRTSLVVVPRRGRLLAAKLTVFTTVSLAGGLVAGLGAFLLGQSILAAHGAPHATLAQADVLRAAGRDQGLRRAVPDGRPSGTRGHRSHHEPDRERVHPADPAG